MRDALPAWLDAYVVPTLRDAGATLPELRIERTQTNVHVSYRANELADEYVPPRVLLEFGARSTGEPSEDRSVVCDAASALPEVAFPTADVRAMQPTRTFWEKATAAHVYCVRGEFRGGDRWSRHWFDIVALLSSGHVSRAVADRSLAAAVAAHKTMFFREPRVDYHAAVGGQLRIVPPTGESLDALRHDFTRMAEAGMFRQAPPSFDELMAQCLEVETMANAAAEAPTAPSA